MGSTPLSIEIDCDRPGVFLLGSQLTSFMLIFIIEVFIGILGERIKIQLLAIFHIEFNKGFKQIGHQVFFVFVII